MRVIKNRLKKGLFFDIVEILLSLKRNWSVLLCHVILN